MYILHLEEVVIHHENKILRTFKSHKPFIPRPHHILWYIKDTRRESKILKEDLILHEKFKK